jgi:hypothetical protein
MCTLLTEKKKKKKRDLEIDYWKTDEKFPGLTAF